MRCASIGFAAPIEGASLPQQGSYPQLNMIAMAPTGQMSELGPRFIATDSTLCPLGRSVQELSLVANVGSYRSTGRCRRAAGSRKNQIQPLAIEPSQLGQFSRLARSSRLFK